ncbi:hypothetical protein [Agaribacterium sp. ZY112]|uniref:hypothetical protein n=1 Tax=Agaribacterium sp. ZY112 TaxID=3233574 RepID=UPI00352334CE
MDELTAAPRYTRVTHTCRVVDVMPLNTATVKVELQSSLALHYHAGQYLALELDVNGDGKTHSLFYSITNAFNPEQPQRLELFIQNSSEFSEKIITRLLELSQVNAEVTVNLPMGQAYLQTGLDATHVLIAAGSGISKIKCIAEEILKQKPDADISIYWSNKNIGDFYLLELFQAWRSQHDKLRFTPILETDEVAWLGRSGYIYKVIDDDFEQLEATKLYLCGSPQMVYGTIDKLKHLGLQEANCYSDAFEFAPRDQQEAS